MPVREDSRSARIRLFTTGVVVVIALSAGADTATAAGSGDALKQARTKYNAAQNKCVKHHQLKQLPRILKFANKIKKLGGGKIKKKQLYKCLKFELRFDDHLTLKGNEHADNRSITHNWSYFVTDLGPGELKPDYKDAASDLVVSSGELLDTHSFSGSATFHRDGNPTSALEQAAGTVGPNANSYGASVLINPSAKDPRKTIELSISPQAVGDQVHADHERRQGRRREDHHPPRDLQVRAAIGDREPPVRRRVGQPEAQEGQRRGVEDEVRHDELPAPRRRLARRDGDRRVAHLHGIDGDAARGRRQRLSVPERLQDVPDQRVGEPVGHQVAECD